MNARTKALLTEIASATIHPFEDGTVLVDGLIILTPKERRYVDKCMAESDG